MSNELSAIFFSVARETLCAETPPRRVATTYVGFGIPENFEEYPRGFFSMGFDPAACLKARFPHHNFCQVTRAIAQLRLELFVFT